MNRTPPARRGLSQRGETMVGLIIWMVLALTVMSTVGSILASLSRTAAVTAEHTGQSSSSMDAMNRIGRDVTASSQIISASSTEIVLDIPQADTGASSISVMKRTRYLYIPASRALISQSTPVIAGTPYDPRSWGPNYSTVVSHTNISDAAPLFTLFDKTATPISGATLGGVSPENVIRVDINVTADVAGKGNVSYATTAVPRLLLASGITR